MTLPTTITITLTDRPNGQLSISTDLCGPIDSLRTPAEAMATCFVEFARLTDATVLQGAEHVPALALAKDLLDPEMYGYAVTPEVHNRARRVLGMPPV